MDWNRLKGKEGDRINAILSAAGMNSRMLFRWVVDCFFAFMRIEAGDVYAVVLAGQIQNIGFSELTILSLVGYH